MMESKHIGYVFTHETDRELCNVVKLSVNDASVAASYGGDDTIDDFISYLENNNVTPIVEWERPRHWPKGRPM